MDPSGIPWRSSRSMPAANVPKYTIDLSLPPKERYKALARAYKSQIQNLTPLFDELLADLGIHSRYHGHINNVAKWTLRGVHSGIETAELKGISEVSGIPMYLLISFNVVLDLLMGCTSGAVLSKESDQAHHQAKMLHFRTLDWDMDPLRKIVVHLDFVRSRSSTPEQIIASSVTYVGYVGVLTGVRPGLSISLNFRPLHNAVTKQEQFRFYFHHLLVLLGMRPSISTILRSYLYSETDDQVKNLATISEEVAPKHTTAAYLVLSNGETTITMEKDYTTAVTRQSSSFIVATNHDRDGKDNGSAPAGDHPAIMPKMAALQELLDESRDRMDCIAKKWKALEQKHRRESAKRGSTADNRVPAISTAEVIRWVSAWPTTNETTHYAVVMDAQQGRVVWSHTYAEPLEEPALRL